MRISKTNNGAKKEYMIAPSHILSKASFGSRTAEDEVDELRGYFVETEQWRKLLSGDVDVVLGAKGAGKSALYSLLVSEREQLRLGRRTLFLAAENPRGTPAFRDLKSAPPLPEETFRGLWKLYFLTIAASYLRHHLESARQTNQNASAVLAVLAQNGLLAPNVTLLTRLKSATEYLRRWLPTVEGGITDPNTGFTVTGKITIAEPSTEQRAAGFRSLDELFVQLDRAFQEENITVWLALDRLDVAFSDSDELEGNALRSLFRVYLDMLALSNIRVKIFLRDDIWKKIVKDGFREASHVTRMMMLSWDQRSLLNLIVRRLASNVLICDLFGMQQDDILASGSLQEKFFYEIFPDQVDIGASKPKTLDWMVSRTADGTKRTAPRELIHLLNETRDQQIKLHELGGAEPGNGKLFDRAALRNALPAVSKIRYEQTLCAEYPVLKPFLDKMERERTQQSKETLGRLWKLSAEKAGDIAERMVETGFFERRGTKDAPSYWVPFLYRDALDLVQGSAN